jgi:betaine lipid synthase
MSLLQYLPFAHDPYARVVLVGGFICIFLTLIFLFAFVEAPKFVKLPEIVLSYAKFFYACFLKPHSGDKNGNQQDALESFYKAQATAYDKTRKRLLHGREDMLGLVGAQMLQKEFTTKPIWIDVSKYLYSFKLLLTSPDRWRYRLEH